MYIHMISTICAVSEIGKKCHVYADEFANHWEFVPYAGGFIAALGIPLIIIILVLLQSCLHVFHAGLWLACIWIGGLSDVEARSCKASNLLFLEQMWSARDDEEDMLNMYAHFVRTPFGHTVQIPMLWAKVSMFSLMYPSLLKDR